MKLKKMSGYCFLVYFLILAFSLATFPQLGISQEYACVEKCSSKYKSCMMQCNIFTTGPDGVKACAILCSSNRSSCLTDCEKNQLPATPPSISPPPATSTSPTLEQSTPQKKKKEKSESLSFGDLLLMGFIIFMVVGLISVAAGGGKK